jgi:hypothetical protein
LVTIIIGWAFGAVTPVTGNADLFDMLYYYKSGICFEVAAAELNAGLSTVLARARLDTGRGGVPG